MFAGRKKETPLAAQIAAVGQIIDGTADIETGDPSITVMPVFIQQHTNRFH
jgi:hypothetical protein